MFGIDNESPLTVVQFVTAQPPAVPAIVLEIDEEVPDKLLYVNGCEKPGFDKT
jgi:hypothetical protein